MAHVSMELMYEVLKSLQARHDKTDQKLEELSHGVQAVRLGLNSVRHEIVVVQDELAGIHATLLRHEHQLDRIDRRLDLNETPPLAT
jgi:chromosome segregation ATPase